MLNCRHGVPAYNPKGTAGDCWLLRWINDLAVTSPYMLRALITPRGEARQYHASIYILA
jgi:hypothetical protein